MEQKVMIRSLVFIAAADVLLSISTWNFQLKFCSENDITVLPLVYLARFSSAFDLLLLLLVSTSYVQYCTQHVLLVFATVWSETMLK